MVEEPGTKLSDPNSWQPLALARIVAQNGIPQPGSVQSFVGPHWGHVQAFALPASDEGVPIDPARRRSSTATPAAASATRSP